MRPHVCADLDTCREIPVVLVLPCPLGLFGLGHVPRKTEESHKGRHNPDEVGTGPTNDTRVSKTPEGMSLVRSVV